MKTDECIPIGRKNDITMKAKTEPIPRSEKKGWSRLSITTEPIIFIVHFVTSFTIGVSLDLMQTSICYQHFNFTWDKCMDIRSMHSDEDSMSVKMKMESMTAQVNLINNEIVFFFPVFLSLFIGPWSDINGRKPFIKWALRGYTLFFTLWGIFSLIPYLPVMCFVIPAIPLSLSGGFVAVVVCSWSYLADIYEENERPFRISVLIGSGLAGTLSGNALSPEVFYVSGIVGYQVIFFSSAALSASALLYTTYVLKESVTLQNDKTNLLNFDNFKSIFVALILRPRHTMIISILIMTILSSELTSHSGNKEMIYLIGKSSFNWSLAKYNTFSALTTIISAVTSVIGVKIIDNLLKWSNYATLLFFSFVMFIMNILKAMSINEIMFWIVSCGLQFSCILGSYVDTEMSKIVHEKDVGKAYAFSALIDALSPVIGMPILTALYKLLLTFNFKHSVLHMFFWQSAITAITFASSLILFILHTWFRDRFWSFT